VRLGFSWHSNALHQVEDWLHELQFDVFFTHIRTRERNISSRYKEGTLYSSFVLSYRLLEHSRVHVRTSVPPRGAPGGLTRLDST